MLRESELTHIAPPLKVGYLTPGFSQLSQFINSTPGLPLTLSAPPVQRSRPIGLGLNVLHIVCSEAHAMLPLLCERLNLLYDRFPYLLPANSAVPPSWILVFLLTSIASASQTSPVPRDTLIYRTFHVRNLAHLITPY